MSVQGVRRVHGASRVGARGEVRRVPALSRAAGTRCEEQRCEGATRAVTEEQVFEAIGEDGFARLIRAFYAQVPADPVLGPMYPKDDLEGAERRLRDFLVGRFGGPQRYVEERGHPRLRMRHVPFAIDTAARNQWVMLMDRALDEAELPAEVTSLLREFFHGVATFMINR